MRWNRREFLGVTGTSALSGVSRKRLAGSAQEPSSASVELRWHSARDWGVEGCGWPSSEMKRFLDRLPARAEGVVRDEVWELSRDSAGMLVRFQTDSPVIHVRYKLFRERLAMSHMPATGVSGVDLYGLDARGIWRWVAVTRPEAREVESPLAGGLDAGLRMYSLYLPLYNGVDSLEIGVERQADFRGIQPGQSKPIVFYGTSITHGACASRPGMAHVAILGRRLGRPVVNLGFSGNGRMEPEVGRFLCEIDAGLYVIDCLPNMDAASVRERTEPLVRQLQSSRAGVPVVLVEDRRFTNAWVRESRRRHHEQSRSELRQAYQRLLDSGVERLHYLEGDSLLGGDDEGATDGSHPSDLGFMRQAGAFEPVLRRALDEVGGIGRRAQNRSRAGSLTCLPGALAS